MGGPQFITVNRPPQQVGFQPTSYQPTSAQPTVVQFPAFQQRPSLVPRPAVTLQPAATQFPGVTLDGPELPLTAAADPPEGPVAEFSPLLGPSLANEPQRKPGIRWNRFRFPCWCAKIRERE